jgi:adenylosuccinate synthase
MATQIKMPKENKDEVQLTQDQQYAAYARKEGHEYGTTTGRPRDICYLDLEMMRFNINAGGIEMLAGTHLDIAEKNRPIKVCTHYTSADGKTKIPYQPGLEYQKNVKPHYVELPGWDGAEVRAAKSFDELPIEAKQFLAFIQRQTGTPIVSVTTGPERQHLIEIPTLQQPDEIYLGAQIPKKGTIFSSN